MARLFNDRGVAKALSGDLQASLADWDEAIALAVGWYPMASKSRGRVLLALRDYSGADRAYRTAIGGPWCSPGTSPCPCNGRRSGGGAQRGADSYRARPGRASPYLILARALRAVSGDDAEADAALATVITICEKDIVQRRDRPVALYLQAYAQLELRRYGEAVASFDEAIGLLRRGGAESSRLFAAYSGYGRALTCAERFGEALGACQRALELAPQSGEQRETRSPTWPTFSAGSGTLIRLSPASRRRGQPQAPGNGSLARSAKIARRPGIVAGACWGPRR